MRGMISLISFGWFIPLLAAADIPVPTQVSAPPLSLTDRSHRDALAHFGSGRIKARSDDNISAAKMLERSIRLDPVAIEPRKDLVKVYIELGRDSAAIRIAREVLAKDPNDVDTVHQLANLLYVSRRYKAAADVLDSVLLSPQLTMRSTTSC